MAKKGGGRCSLHHTSQDPTLNVPLRFHSGFQQRFEFKPGSLPVEEAALFVTRNAAASLCKSHVGFQNGKPPQGPIWRGRRHNLATPKSRPLAPHPPTAPRPKNPRPSHLPSVMRPQPRFRPHPRPPACVPGACARASFDRGSPSAVVLA